MAELYDSGAERAVLAGLYQYGSEAFVEVSDILTEESFGSVNNAAIYRCFKYIIEQNMSIDLPSILSSCEKLSLTQTVTTDQNIQFIKSLNSLKVNRDNIFNFAVQIKKFEYARNIKDIVAQIDKDIDNINGTETINDIISMIESPLTEFIKEDSIEQKPEKIGEDIFEYLDFIANNKCDMIGIPTGLPRYDKAIGGGLRRKCVDLIAARPKTGKSVFADAAAINISKNKIPVLMLDTEMSKDDHKNRILASISGVEINDISTGKYLDDPDKVEAVIAAARQVQDLTYDYVNISGVPFNSIMNIIKRWVLHKVGKDENGNTNDCVVIFDYLKLMSSDGINSSMQEYQLLGFQITSLHNLCVKLDIPCLAFVQLNRDGINKESTDAVSGSDRLIWLCTSFTIFKNKSQEEISQDGVRNGNRKLVPIVSRHGGGLFDGDYINVSMEGEIARITELKTRNEIKSRPDDSLISDDSLNSLDEEEESTPWEA
jgi:replicative DNA helicase